MSVNFNFTVFASQSADAGISPALLSLIQGFAYLNGVPLVQVLQTQPSVLRQFAAAAAGSHGVETDDILSPSRHGHDGNGLRRTLADGMRYYSAPPIPIARPRAPAPAENLTTKAQHTVRPRREPVNTRHRSPPREPPENTQRTPAVPPHAAPGRDRGKAVSQSPPAAATRKRKARAETPMPPPAPPPTPAPPTRRDRSSTTSTISGDTPPPKPPAGPTLYSHRGKKRFSEEARAWFNAYWRWILVRAKAEGRLPSITEASRIIYKHASEAGLDMSGPTAFKQYHQYYRVHKMAEIEKEVLGRLYRGPEELTAMPPPERRERPVGDDDAPPRKKRRCHPKARNQQSTRIRLTEEEERHMVYRMGYDTEENGRISRVWATMCRKFPERGFGDAQWEAAYRQNKPRIDNAVAAGRPSVKSEGV